MRVNGIINYLRRCGELGKAPQLSSQDARALTKRFDAMTQELVRAASQAADDGEDKRDADVDAHVIERFSTILAEISLTLKGAEQPLRRHSYHDLPKLVAELKLEVDLHRANEARAALSADGGEDKRDAERLDFMIEQQAWVQWTVRDGSIRQCQVYAQDEDENYHILSGEDRFFSTPREAIDAAIAAKAKGEAS